LLGNHGAKSSYTETIDTWVKNNPQKVPHKLIKKSIDAIEKITSSDSELNELWEVSDGYEKWIK